MPDTAPFLISIDVGSVLIKAVLLHSGGTGGQEVVGWTVRSAMVVERTLSEIITDFKQHMRTLEPSSGFGLVMVGHPPDIAELAEAAFVSRFSHAESLSSVVRRLSWQGSAMAVDIGSHRTLVGVGAYGKVSLESFDYGVGAEGWSFLRRFKSADWLRQWLPVDMPKGAIENYVARKGMYPDLVPNSAIEQAMEQALAKLILMQIRHEMAIDWPDEGQVVLTGAVLAGPVQASQGMAMVLDGLQPTGQVSVLSDPQLELLALGGAFEQWSAEDYRVGRSLLRAALEPLGTAICLGEEDPRQGKRLARILIDTGLSKKQELQVRAGELTAVPWPTDQAGTISIKARYGGWTEEERPIGGGLAGLVVDGRPRPLVLASTDKQRRVELQAWDKQLNAHDQVGRIGES